MKKYFITGYSGFVSGHFLNLLESLKEPVEVLGVDLHPPEETPVYQYVSCSFVQIDLLDKEAINKILLDFSPDYLLHLASYSSVAYSWTNPVNAFVNNTNIFLNLIDQVRLLNLHCRILSIGSSEEYGKVTKDKVPIAEEAAIKPTSPYAVARVSQEMLSEIYANNFNVDIILTRSFNHIGPGQKEIFVISSFAKKLTDIKKGRTVLDTINVGDISLVRDFIDVRDVVEAYYLLFQKGKRGEIYNICSGIGFSLEDILKKMMKMLGLSLNINQDKSLIRPDDNKIIIGSNKKIFNETGWQPSVPLEKSLRNMIDYWMEKE